jgi:hypothetical protein
MESPLWLTILTIIIAVYSAILATFLGYKDLLRGRRKIALYIQFFAPYQKAKLIICNSGYRPITITSIRMVIYKEKKKKFVDSENIPADKMFEDEHEYYKIPFSLKDGEMIDFILSETLIKRILEREDDEVIKVVAVDAEGYFHSSTDTYTAIPKYETVNIK